MKVLITGATGFVGRQIVRQLLEAGDEVVVLTRNVAKGILTLGNGCEFFVWSDTNRPAPAEAFAGVDGVINLMGEGIAEKRWSEEQKRRIYDSRIKGTASLLETMGRLEKRPSVFVSTSAVGIYGNRETEELTEASATGDDFLARLCKDWEKEASHAMALGIRLAIIRVGVVLGKNGGALKKMLPIFKFGAGGRVGSGKQVMSWVHVEDLAAMFVRALKDPSIQGVYNGTAPGPVTNEEFTKVLGKVLRKPTIAPAPAFAMKLVFGEMSAVLLEGQRVLPAKFQEARFSYRYPGLEAALRDATA